ncbi:PTC1 [Symbiodinium pilosum]|uniref:PTC1 protein n=1 Tax=Symbiodinium pilosum TaxID=2952 RepID=A0A812V1K3_SYMPI|nr:PTC1 [Symbiodinium pilosum]
MAADGRVRAVGRTLLASLSQQAPSPSGTLRTSKEDKAGDLKAHDLVTVRNEARAERAPSRGLPNQVPTPAAQRRLSRAREAEDQPELSRRRDVSSSGTSYRGSTRPQRRGSLQERAAALDRIAQAPPSRQRPAKAVGRAVPKTTATLCRAASEANAAFRAHMEDSSVAIDPLLVEQDGEVWGYFAVYDGHGGRQAVDFCEAKLHGLVLDELLNVTRMAGETVADDVVAEVLSRAFRRVDEQLKLLGTWRCGCTATVVLAHRTLTGLRLHAANVGDSRAIVIDSGSESRLTRDHRPTDPAEIQRVEAEGGFVARGRVVGQLGVSRALGDHSLKSVGVTWHPHVCTREVAQDAALVIASDGLWDVMADGDARAVVERSVAERMYDKAPELLIKAALRAGSTDNTTALVAFFGLAQAHCQVETLSLVTCLRCCLKP